MENGYKVLWTDSALIELKNTVSYLEENFSEKEIRKLAFEIERTVNLIAKNPTIFPMSKKKGVRKAVVQIFNTLYYRINENHVEILFFFSNRQNPKI